MSGSRDETTEGHSDETGDTASRSDEPGARGGNRTAEPEELAASLEDIPDVFPHGSAHPTSEADAPPPG